LIEEKLEVGAEYYLVKCCVFMNSALRHVLCSHPVLHIL